MILIGGHRPRTARASLIPSIDPGMLMSVNTILISSRLSKILTASSAFDAQSGSNPAPRIHVDRKHKDKGLVLDREHHRAMGTFHHDAFPGCAPERGGFPAAASFNVSMRLSIPPDQ